MSEITRVGADLAKRVIQVHGVDTSGKLVTNRALPRDKFIAWCVCVHRLREGFKTDRTACVNRIRGLLAEFGLVFGKTQFQRRLTCTQVMS